MSNSMIYRPGVLNVDESGIPDSEHNLDSKHKVFLSHSGAQKDFVEQLHIDLERCDIYPFFDKHRSSLPIGEKFPKLIFDAIEQCWVGVLVLSEDFFIRSKWPMLELNAMVKEFEKPTRRITIIPVFYLISVKVLKDKKNQSRWIAQWNQWARSDEDKRINVKEWKKALRILESINSIVTKEGHGDVKVRKEIVGEVRRLVPPEIRWDDSHVEGRLRICKVIREKMDEVSTNSRVCVVGLYGMGGIGKTTICKALCNNLSSKFHDNVYHVEFGSASEMELLRKALKKLTNTSHDVLKELDDIEKGFVYLKKRLLSQPLFLALDNVQDDLKSIEGAQSYLKANYGPDSVVLVTARSVDVLKKLIYDESNCLEMLELEDNEARSLFLNYINVPSKNEINEVLIKDCLERCHFFKGDGRSKHYHPLALKVLGQQLDSTSTQEWALQLSKIDAFKQPGEKVHPIFSILRNSFDSLEYEHQLVFMDLALSVPTDDGWRSAWTRLDWLCMVHDKTVEDMKDKLEALKRKSLLEDLRGGFIRIGMHDLWREFAVGETKAQSIIHQRWAYQVDGMRTLERSGRKNIERMCFMEEGWRALKRLELHDFVNVVAFKLKVEIHTTNCDLDLDLSRLKHMKSLHLKTFGLTVRAHGLRNLTNLVDLIWETREFSPCSKDVGCLTNLHMLEMKQCNGIEVLNFSELKLLRVVLILGLRDLITIRGFSPRLSNLRVVVIFECTSLQECPGLGELYALEELLLRKCSKLKELPCLRHLTSLKKLDIHQCKSIREVPGLSDLVTLEDFCAQGCLKLVALPDMQNLTRLQVLNICQCPVQGVPGLNRLLALTTLWASFGQVLGPIFSSIQNLVMLEELSLRDCKREDVVPDLQNLKKLKTIYFLDCEFKDLSGLSNLTALETLAIEGCRKLERLPDFERLTKLIHIWISSWNNLIDWPCTNTLSSLVTLKVDGSILMKIVPNLKTLTNLRFLELMGSGCDIVLSMASLSQLEGLAIIRFPTTEALDLHNFPQLKDLEVFECRALNRLTCSRPLTTLNELKVTSCDRLVELPDLSVFPQLEKLSLENCGALKRVTCSRPLSTLKEIKLIGCNCQIEMPVFNKTFPKLKVFRRDD